MSLNYEKQFLMHLFVDLYIHHQFAINGFIAKKDPKILLAGIVLTVRSWQPPSAAA